MKIVKTATRLVLATGLTLALASSAAADTIVPDMPTDHSTIVVEPTPTIGPLIGGSYLWSYTVTLEGDSTIETGDFFTILDFTGLVAGSQNVVAGWSASSSNTGLCPTTAGGFQVACNFFDDPLVPNLTWTRTGASITQDSGSQVLGEFSARSIFNLPANEFWFSQDRDDQTQTSDEPAGGATNVPVGLVTPEPASMALLGLGLFSVGLATRRRRQQVN